MSHGRCGRCESHGGCAKSESQEGVDAIRVAAEVRTIVESDSHILRVDEVAESKQK